jgi:acyl-CoA reductase-like NAD-dependent aldehyde dehydrogenase
MSDLSIGRAETAEAPGIAHDTTHGTGAGVRACGGIRATRLARAIEAGRALVNA